MSTCDVHQPHRFNPPSPLIISVRNTSKAKENAGKPLRYLWIDLDSNVGFGGPSPGRPTMDCCRSVRFCAIMGRACTRAHMHVLSSTGTNVPHCIFGGSRPNTSAESKPNSHSILTSRSCYRAKLPVSFPPPPIRSRLFMSASSPACQRHRN